MGETEDERSSQASQLFENFVQASTCKGTLQAFGLLCRQLELDPADHRGFYSSLKAAVTSWKAKALWTKLDKRATHKEYKKGRACADIRVCNEIKMQCPCLLFDKYMKMYLMKLTNKMHLKHLMKMFSLMMSVMDEYR